MNYRTLPRPRRELWTERERRKVGLKPVMTAARYHESAYMAGRQHGIHMLDVFVGIQEAQELFDSRLRYMADREYIRGFLDVLMPMLGDVCSLLHQHPKLERALRECVSDDFNDCARVWLRTLQQAHAIYEPSGAQR